MLIIRLRKKTYFFSLLIKCIFHYLFCLFDKKKKKNFLTWYLSDEYFSVSVPANKRFIQLLSFYRRKLLL